MIDLKKENMRTALCAMIGEEEIGQKVTLTGWVAKERNKGGIIFVDLRDRSGIMQVIFDDSRTDPEVFSRAQDLHSEYVIAVEGVLQVRSGAPNPGLKTGKWEVLADDLVILSRSETPPFPVEDEIRTKDELRLKYRFLDLRRPEIQKNLILRSRMASVVRNHLSGEGFLEIETPCLIKSTPEGARDYLVPSRVHPGSFYALPQSPQLFKQLLMCSGFDRYYQIARCFRDEDLRADRQPEFTQIDMELSFANAKDVMAVNTGLLGELTASMAGFYRELGYPGEKIEAVEKAAARIRSEGIPAMPWQEAMDRYGSDKPDIRFEMELCDISDLVKECGFSVFADAVAKKGTVRGICVKGGGSMGRKRIDKLTETAKTYGAKGLAYLQLTPEGECKSSFAKFLTEEEITAIIDAFEAKDGDLILLVADQNKVVYASLGALRTELGAELELYDENEFRFVWITDFPLLEWSEEEGRFMAMHHPFTMPKEEDFDRIDSDPGSVRAEAYDIVLNGNEIGGGSVRIHKDDVQEKMLEVLGFTKEVANEQFGFLLNAFRYGVPPHAGLAYGLDRLVMIFAGCPSLRDVIAFPKIKDASDLMIEAPSAVDEKQLKELGITVVKENLTKDE